MNQRDFFPTEEMYNDFMRFSKMDEAERKVFSEENVQKIRSMTPEELKTYDDNLIKGVQTAADMAKKEDPELALYLKMSDVSKYISLAQIATDYFGKTKQWLYQRLKNYNVNNKPASFTPEEKEQFRQALLDVSKKIEQMALTI